MENSELILIVMSDFYPADKAALKELYSADGGGQRYQG